MGPEKVGFWNAWAPKTNFFLGKDCFVWKISMPRIAKTDFFLGKSLFFQEKPIFSLEHQKTIFSGATTVPKKVVFFVFLVLVLFVLSVFPYSTS